MWRWLVLWQASLLLVVSGTLDLRFLNKHYASSKLDCFEYPSAMPIRTYEPGWGLPRQFARMLPSTQKHQKDSIPLTTEITRRFDILSSREDIIKEHAKLVQDINGLKQVMFVAPLGDESKDYEDSIFHEIIETSSTTTSRPSVTKSLRPTKSGIPIVLLGGTSRKHTNKNQSLKNKRQTLSLIGTSVTPLVRQPSPYILPTPSRPPIRICMSSPYTTYAATTHRQSLWERLLKSLIPR